MKQSQIWTALLILIAVCAAAAYSIHHVRVKQTQEKARREVGYESTLRSFWKELNAGMTRKEVEDHLRSKNILVRQRNETDLIKIGEEAGTWYCSRQDIYIAMTFVAVDRRDFQKSNPSDTLQSVVLLRSLEDCL